MTAGSKERKMQTRLNRGVLLEGQKNSGMPNSSKLHPNCKWAKRHFKDTQ